MARLLFASHTAGLGGPAHSLLKLIKYLPPDHETAVLVPQDGALVSALAQQGVPHYVNPLRIRALPALVRIIRRGRFDLVYANNFCYHSTVALWGAKLAGKPFVWHIREMVRTPTASNRWLRYADAIIAVSQASADLVARYVPREKITVVYNGVEPDEFALARLEARRRLCDTLGVNDNHIIMVSVGHICERKNQRHAVDAAADVARDYPEVLFCFLGRLDHSPDYASAIQDDVHRLGLDDNIRFMGFQKDTPVYLCGADVYFHTAIIDPHPRAVIEAMAASLPVIAYRTGGVPETVVDGETGILAPLEDVSGLVQAAETLLANETLRRQMGIRGRQRVEQLFTAPKTAQEVNTVIERVLRKS